MNFENQRKLCAWLLLIIGVLYALIAIFGGVWVMATGTLFAALAVLAGLLLLSVIPFYLGSSSLFKHKAISNPKLALLSIWLAFASFYSIVGIPLAVWFYLIAGRVGEKLDHRVTLSSDDQAMYELSKKKW